MTTEKLKSCPFCGGAAEYVDDTRVGFTTFSGLGNVSCSECRRSDGFIYKSFEAAQKSWNTRADLSDAKIIKAAKELADAVGDAIECGSDVTDAQSDRVIAAEEAFREAVSEAGE